MKADYRLCKVVEIKPCEDDLATTARVAIRPRKKNEPADTCRGQLHYVNVGIKRLVLIVPTKEEKK